MVLLYFGGRVRSLAALALCRNDFANSFVDSRLDRHPGKLVSLLRHQGGAMDERGYDNADHRNDGVQLETFESAAAFRESGMAADITV